VHGTCIQRIGLLNADLAALLLPVMLHDLVTNTIWYMGCLRQKGLQHVNI